MTTEKSIVEAIADKIIEYLNARRDGKEESFLKSKPNKNKQGKVTNGAIIERFIAELEKHFPSSDAKKLLDPIKKSKKLTEQTSLSFQQQKLDKLLRLADDAVVDTAFAEIKNEYHEFINKNFNEHQPFNWLNQWSQKASDISFATHVGKLTHSSSKSSSIFDSTKEHDDRYLSTNRLKNAFVDIASTNAASLPIADVLSLAVSGVSLLELVKSGEHSVFNRFTDDQKIIDQWVKNLKQSFDSNHKQSYFLSKQIYFPIGRNDYHLLMPLNSSSLAHELYLEQKKRWDEPRYKLAFDQKNNGKYSETIVAYYPNKALLHVTASNHSNASALNGKRGGRLILMSALPPQWSTKVPSYKDKDNLFSKLLAFELKNEINELFNYLSLLKNKQLSDSEPKRNADILQKVQAISAQLFNYIDTVNDAEENRGWTIDSKLDVEYQLLFEPWRNDETVINIKINNDWQFKIAKDFGRWLNQQLNKNKKLKLTPIQAALWTDCFKIQLKEYVAVQEALL